MKFIEACEFDAICGRANDCSVFALSLLAGIDVYSAKRIALLKGLTPIGMPVPKVIAMCWDTLDIRPSIVTPETITVREFLACHSGKFLLFVKGHVIGVNVILERILKEYSARIGRYDDEISVEIVHKDNPDNPYISMLLSCPSIGIWYQLQYWNYDTDTDTGCSLDEPVNIGMSHLIYHTWEPCDAFLTFLWEQMLNDFSPDEPDEESEE